MFAAEAAAARQAGIPVAVVDHDAITQSGDARQAVARVPEGHPDAVHLLIEKNAAVNAQTRVGPTPEFRPPCKGTGCGSEGVGINRGGLPDRGRRAG